MDSISTPEQISRNQSLRQGIIGLFYRYLYRVLYTFSSISNSSLLFAPRGSGRSHHPNPIDLHVCPHLFYGKYK